MTGSNKSFRAGSILKCGRTALLLSVKSGSRSATSRVTWPTATHSTPTTSEPEPFPVPHVWRQKRGSGARDARVWRQKRGIASTVGLSFQVEAWKLSPRSSAGYGCHDREDAKRPAQQHVGLRRRQFSRVYVGMDFVDKCLQLVARRGLVGFSGQAVDGVIQLHDE